MLIILLTIYVRNSDNSQKMDHPIFNLKTVLNMNKRKLKFLIILLLGLSLARIQAQEAVTTSGGNASGSGGTGSFCIGQVVYTTVSGTSGTSKQGVLSPFEISVSTGIDDAINIVLEFSVYPNPTEGFVSLNIGDYDTKGLNYQLYDIKGKIIQEDKVNDVQTQISLANLSSGIYLLKVFDNKKELKVFKIIKN
jgi:hypothetical protein